jgi:hypothetical protein
MINEKSTKEEVMQAVREYSHALKYASEQLRGDREVVLQALRQNFYAFMYASHKLQFEIVKCWLDCMKINIKGE